jgi:hypothetical protein
VHAEQPDPAEHLGQLAYRRLPLLVPPGHVRADPVVDDAAHHVADPQLLRGVERVEVQQVQR